MPLTPGTRLGPYEILAPLGAGGMGEVYRARDSRLERTVAVKVLPSDRSASRESRLRLEREAKTISKLSHPHICALFDVGHQDGTDFLVMELLEGETLAERLTKGPLPLEQAIRFGVQIADALDRAHRQGIVHRDLKPGNIMLTKSGVKLLDFGLAKAFTPLFPSVDAPTMSIRPDLSVEGTVAGTFQYMAPEQLEGKPADARSDIFAFGVVLFEMVTGSRPFSGNNPAALASSILSHEPPRLSSLQPKSPPELDRIVRTCLTKDPEHRWQTAHDVGLQLAATSEKGLPASPGSAPVPARGAVARWLPWAIAAAAFAFAIASLLRTDRPSGTPAQGPVRFAIPSPPNGSFFQFVETPALALSPDGSQLAFVALNAEGVQQIWWRPLAALEAQPLAGTEDAISLFWSPDNRSIAFFAGGKLKRLDLPKGAPVALCDVPSETGIFGTWGAGGQILYASTEGPAVYRVATSGGAPTEAIKPDSSRNETKVCWPWFLPDGKRFVYVVRRPDLSGELMLAEPGKTPRPVLKSVTSNVQWVDPDFLVFVRDGTIVGQRFDLSSGRAVGDPFSIAEPVSFFPPTGCAYFTASRNGALVYQSHRDQFRLAWFDRSGRELGTAGASADYYGVRIAPDGRSAITARLEPKPQAFDLWTIDLLRGIETRVTSGIGAEVRAEFVPGSNAVVFAAGGGAGPLRLFRKDLGTGAEHLLLTERAFQIPMDVSPDGKSLIYGQRTEQGPFDLWALSLAGDPNPVRIVQSTFDEGGARFSPDGRYLVYASDESGRYEAYVMPFTPGAARTRVSTGGATTLFWSRDGREIFYVSGDGKLTSVPVRVSPRLELGTPTPLFALTGHAAWADFDVSADGKRFLVIVPEVVADKAPLTAILNWPAEIGR